MVIISDQKEIQTNSNHQVYGSKATLAQVSNNYMLLEVPIVFRVF